MEVKLLVAEEFNEKLKLTEILEELQSKGSKRTNI